MNDLTFLEQFAKKYAWRQAPAKRRFRFRKRVNRGMEEEHRLALTLGGVIDRALDDDEGLQSSDYSTYQIFEADDLVFKLIDLENIRTSRVGYVPRRGIMSPAYIRLEPTSKQSNSRYYYWFFYGAYINNIFNGMGGGVRQNLTPTDLLEFPIPLPDLQTQNSIADFLDRETARIDQLIEKKQRLVGLLTQKQNAFTTCAATRGLANNTRTSETGLEALPAAPSHWEVLRMATLFRESQEMGQEGLPVLSVSINWGISDRELTDDDRHRIVNQIEDKSAYKRVRQGDLVYNMMRAWQGAFGVAKVDGLVSPAYVVARPTRELHAPYFEHLLRTPMWIEDFRRASKGIADFRQRLYWEHFRQVRVVLPPLGEQVQIASAIERISESIARVVAPITASIELLREHRGALITAAVTGQIDVATWGKKGQSDRYLENIEG